MTPTTTDDDYVRKKGVFVVFLSFVCMDYFVAYLYTYIYIYRMNASE